MVKCDVLPAGWDMAERTILPKLTVVMVVFCMARETILRRSFEIAVGMAGQTIHPHMIANKWKGCFIMVKCSARPGRRLMTCPAIPAILTIVDISRCMTRETIARGIFVNAIDVTGFAINIDMRARQREAGRVVIELRGLPRGCCMALPADRAELTHMRVDLLVARKTILWRAFKNGVHMAQFTCHLHMGAGQFEYGAVVIKGRWTPPLGRMTRSAVRSKASLMRIILCMTGEAILTGCLQGGNGSGLHVTLRAHQSGMFSIQLEGEFIVIEIMTVTFDAVVTFKTAVSECHFMIHHEGDIHADVAFRTGQHIELSDILPVTIRAQERFILRRELMTP